MVQPQLDDEINQHGRAERLGSFERAGMLPAIDQALGDRGVAQDSRKFDGIGPVGAEILMEGGSRAGIITACQTVLAALKPQKRRPLREHPQSRLQKLRIKPMLAGKLFGGGGCS